MLHIAMEIMVAAIGGFTMVSMIGGFMHEFGKFIIESNKTKIEDCSQI